MKIHNYNPLSGDFWQGRIDDPNNPDTFRWHQSIQLINLENDNLVTIINGKRGFCIIGFACDKGVEKNQGRIGTANGPFSIRKELANLPDRFSDYSVIYDAGNIYCLDDDLAKAQEALQLVVRQIFKKTYAVYQILLVILT